jgi:ribosome-associated protein
MSKNQSFPQTPLLEVIVDGIEDKKGEQIVVMDLTDIDNAVCDYFVVCQANSDTQVGAIARSVEDKVREVLKEKPWHTEGKANAEWVLMDFVDTVVHIFRKDVREFYAIEELWGDAPVFEIEEKY